MDMVPPGFTGDCQPADVLAPEIYCTGYAACAGTARDKLGCTAMMAPAEIHRCTVAFSAAGLCGNAQLVLMGASAGICNWTLDGSTVRDGYTLGLLDASSMPQTGSTVCNPTFAITAYSGSAGGATAAFLHLAGASVRDVAVLITPQQFATCPAAGLECF
jgi:hypothetical protein